MNHCSIPGCTNPHKACRGLCRHHYRRLHLYGDPLGNPPEDKGIRTLRELVAIETTSMGLDPGTTRDVIYRRTWRHVDEVAA